MIKNGSVIIAKFQFLIEQGIPYESREFRVVESGYNFISIESVCGEYSYAGSMNFAKDFYLPSSINMEVQTLLDGNIELKSFQAVTMDNKIIQIEKT